MLQANTNILTHALDRNGHNWGVNILGGVIGFNKSVFDFSGGVIGFNAVVMILFEKTQQLDDYGFDRGVISLGGVIIRG